MADLDDVFGDEDLGLGETLENTEVEEQYPLENDDIFADVTPTVENNTILDEFLKLKGLENNLVTILEEDNTEKTVNFYDLTKEEQLDLLNAAPENNSDDLDEGEIELLNHLRTNNLSVTNFLENYKQEILNEVTQNGQAQTENYEIDSYDDQELFLLDLKDKYELTDEELIKELEKELQDEGLFKKKVDKIRLEYKTLEDNYKETKVQEELAEKTANYNQFVEKMVDVAVKTPDFYGIDLEDDEKNEVLSSILELDENGASQFYKSLNNPDNLYKAAWFLRYGEEAFSVLKNAYEQEITRLKKDNRTTQPSVVVKKNREINSIHELNY